MGAAPAFQFYASDWAHSVSSMTLDERGAYITLLAWSWEHGPVPGDIRRLAAILGASTAQAKRVWAEVSKRWQLGENGQWINRRLEEVRAKQAEFQEKQAAKGRASGAARANRRPTGNEPRFEPGTNHGSTGVPTGRQPQGQPEAQPQGQPQGNSPISNLRSPDPVGRDHQREKSRKEQCADAHAVLVRLAHDVLADIESGALPSSDAKEELKYRAGQARIAYDSAAVTKALDSAEHQRARRANAS